MVSQEIKQEEISNLEKQAFAGGLCTLLGGGLGLFAEYMQNNYYYDPNKLFELSEKVKEIIAPYHTSTTSFPFTFTMGSIASTCLALMERDQIRIQRSPTFFKIAKYTVPIIVWSLYTLIEINGGVSSIDSFEGDVGAALLGTVANMTIIFLASRLSGSRPHPRPKISKE